MTSQKITPQQQGFFKRCEECYNLVLAFLTDELPHGFVPSRHTGYTFDSKLRDSVKEKVKATIQRLENSIDLHGYVFYEKKKKATIGW